MANEIAAAADLFRVLGNESRLGLLVALADGPLVVGALVEATGMTQPLVSQHLRTLRQAGLVEVTRDGRTGEYRLADEHVVHVITDALTHVTEPDATRRNTLEETT